MPEQDITSIIKLDIDRSAAKRVETATKRIKDQLNAFKQQVAALDAQLQREGIFDRVEQSSAGARQALGDLKSEVARTRKELGKLDTEFKGARGPELYEARIKDAAKQTKLFRNVGERTRDIGGGVAAIGGVAGQGVEQKLFIASDLLDAAEGLGRIKAELPALTSNLVTAAGGVNQLALVSAAGAAAVVGLYLAIQGLKTYTQEAEDEVNRYLAAQDAIREATGKTSDEIQKEIDDKNAYLQSLKDQRAREQEVRDEINSLEQDFLSADAWILGLGEAVEKLPLGISYGIENVQNDIDDLGKEIAKTEGEIDGLTAALNDGGTAAADMAAIIDGELAKAQQRRIDAFANEAQWAMAYADAAKETVDTRLEQIRVEKLARAEQLAGLRSLPGASEDTTAAIAAVEAALITLNQEESYLTKTVYAGAVARTTAAEKEDDLTEARQDAIEAAEQLAKDEAALNASRIANAKKLSQAWRDEQAKIEATLKDNERAFAEDLNQLLTDRATEDTRDAEDFALDRMRALADHYSDLAKLDAQYARDRQSVVDDLRESEGAYRADLLDEMEAYNKDAIKAAKDHQRDLAKIRRDSDRDIQNAAARLDAWAVRDLQTRREDDLNDAEEQYQDEKKLREDAYADKLDDLEKERDADQQAAAQALRDLQDKHQREQAERNAAFQLELTREDEDRRIAAQRRRDDRRAEDVEMRRHYKNQKTALQTHYDEMETATTTGLKAVRLAYQQGLRNLAGTPGGEVIRTPKPKRYALGGYPPVGQDVIVGEHGPEIARFMAPVRVYPSGGTSTSRTVGDMTFVINEAGDVTRTRQEVISVLTEVLG